MAEANRSQRPPYATNGAPPAHAPKNAGDLSLVRENHKRPEPASTVAWRRGEAPYAFQPMIVHGTRYNKSKAPPVRASTTARRDQIKATPGRIQPNPDAFLENQSNKRGPFAG